MIKLFLHYVKCSTLNCGKQTSSGTVYTYVELLPEPHSPLWLLFRRKQQNLFVTPFSHLNFLLSLFYQYFHDFCLHKLSTLIPSKALPSYPFAVQLEKVKHCNSVAHSISDCPDYGISYWSMFFPPLCHLWKFHIYELQTFLATTVHLLLGPLSLWYNPLYKINYKK